MALVYLDPTALVQLCVPAPGSALVSALWERADAVVTARISDSQVRSHLARAGRDGDLAPDRAGEASARWARLREGISFVELAGPVVDRAGELADDGLAPLAAQQVASALAVRHDDTVVATWDAAIADALRSRAVRVVP